MASAVEIESSEYVQKMMGVTDCFQCYPVDLAVLQGKQPNKNNDRIKGMQIFL